MGTVIRISLAIAAAYLLVVAIAYFAQRRLMYFPDSTRIPPASLGLVGVEEVVLTAPDGARLVAWRSPAQPGQPTLLYLHGNGGNLASRAMRFARYQARGLGLLMLSWRGYSGSTGSPTEAHNVADAERAYQLLLADGVSAREIVLFGESLGTGVAVQLAARLPVAAVVLDAPYTSIVEVARRAYPFLPVGPLLRDRYETRRHISGLEAPLLILHGARDTVIPVDMGRSLHAMAPGEKNLVVFPQGNHVDLDDHGAVDAVMDWLLRRGVAGRR